MSVFPVLSGFPGFFRPGNISSYVWYVLLHHVSPFFSHFKLLCIFCLLFLFVSFYFFCFCFFFLFLLLFALFCSIYISLMSFRHVGSLPAFFSIKRLNFMCAFRRFCRRLSSFLLLQENLCVPLRVSENMFGFKLHTLVTANFSSRCVTFRANRSTVHSLQGWNSCCVESKCRKTSGIPRLVHLGIDRCIHLSAALCAVLRTEPTPSVPLCPSCFIPSRQKSHRRCSGHSCFVLHGLDGYGGCGAAFFACSVSGRGSLRSTWGSCFACVVKVSPVNLLLLLDHDFGEDGIDDLGVPESWPSTQLPDYLWPVIGTVF